MPKPYHTPKSERDEAVGSLTEAEEIAESVEDEDFDPSWFTVTTGEAGEDY